MLLYDLYCTNIYNIYEEEMASTITPPPITALSQATAGGGGDDVDLSFTPRSPAPSHVSVTMDSLDETQAEDENNSGSRRRRSCTPLCVCIPATFITLFVVFVGTLTGAIISWHHYEKLRLHDTWFTRDCTIVSRDIGKSNDTDRWRAQADVNITTGGKVITAFWGRSHRYILSKSAAKSYIDRLPSVGQKVVCYVKHDAPEKISMVKITRRRLPQEDVYLNMAWGSSFFAAVSGFLLLTLAVNFVQRALVFAVTGGEHGRGEGRGGNHDDGTGSGAPKRAGCLTPTQTRWIVAEFGESVGAEKLPSEWTCSICLEDADNCQNKLRVVVLPCSHRFHTRCIRRWLRRGSPTCPLCNWDVSTLFNEEGLPLDAEGNALNSPIGIPGIGGVNPVVVDLRHGVVGS